MRTFSLYKLAYHELTLTRISNVKTSNRTIEDCVSVHSVVNQVFNLEKDNYNIYGCNCSLEIDNVYLVHNYEQAFNEIKTSCESSYDKLINSTIVMCISIDIDESDLYFVILDEEEKDLKQQIQDINKRLSNIEFLLSNR